MCNYISLIESATMWSITRPAIFLSVIALSACSSVVRVADVTANPEAYQSGTFNREALPDGVRKALPESAAAGNFTRLVFKKGIILTGSDDKVDKAEATSTYTDLGNGVVSVRSEMSRNGISFLITYMNNYHGMLVLRSQTVPLRSTSTTAITEVKSISHITPLPFAPGKDFNVKFESGPTMQVMNFSPSEKKCTAGPEFAASQVHAAIPGKAFEMRCEFIYQNVVQTRTKSVYFEQYGFAIETENVGSSSKSVTRITEFKG
jgi:hypothetical protein